MESFSIVKYDNEYYFQHHKSRKVGDVIGVFACLTSENEIFVNDTFKEYLEGSLEEILTHNHLFTEGASNDWSDIKDNIIINFMRKYTFESFKQEDNHLLINDGIIDIVFTGEVPQLEFDSFCKDQLILKIKK